MKIWPYTLYFILLLLPGCDSRDTPSNGSQQDSLAPREATDPVPEPPTQPDTSSEKNQKAGSELKKETTATREVHYRLTGTEPFWSLTLGRPYSTYRSMAGDSISFAYTKPKQAAGRQEEWAQLFMLGDQSWVLLRKAASPCSDGMSDKKWAYTATVWLQGKLLDGCAEKK